MASPTTEIRHLRAISVLARELHFGRAAQRLNMTQPALSQLIKDLENKLGLRLLERTTRKVLLTDAGHSFAAEADAILVRLEQAIEQTRTQAGRPTDSIRIGAILPTSFELLPAALSAFRRRHPKTHIQIDSKESPQLVTGLESGALHVALLRPPSNNGSLRIETLRHDPFVAAIRTDHRLAKATTLKLSDLKRESVIRIARGDLREAFGHIDNQLTASGFDLKTSSVVDTTLTALALVSAGDGVSLVPAWAAAMPWRDVCFRDVRDLTADIELAVAWDASNLPPIAQHFIDVVRRIAKPRAKKV